MSKNKDMMLDLETLGTSPGSVIVQIGACEFDRHTGRINRCFLVDVDINSCLYEGLKVDGNTIYWWMGQKATWNRGHQISLGVALLLFDTFCGVVKPTEVWSHATFDIPMLASAYKAVGRAMPFNYRTSKDIRTLTHLSGITKQDMVKHTASKSHNALEDCIFQVEYCVECFRRLKGNKNESGKD